MSTNIFLVIKFLIIFYTKRIENRLYRFNLDFHERYSRYRLSESVTRAGFIINVIFHIQTAYGAKCTVRSTLLLSIGQPI